MREEQDNIINILKSIPVIKFNFSKKNKQFDKTFKHKSLENLLKNLDYHPKLHDEYAPSPEFLNHKNQIKWQQMQNKDIEIYHKILTRQNSAINRISRFDDKVFQNLLSDTETKQMDDG